MVIDSRNYNRKVVIKAEYGSNIDPKTKVS